VDPRRIDSALLRLDDLAGQIAGLEERIAARRGERNDEAPVPQAADGVADAR
jgi:hypothetical protein